ncbi:MAG: ankyrin repeat domain-containing protein, partial [Akkermansia sp.]|nr:ankyrin repeat domain-containing protein [Akkermansia sp.]
TIAAERNRIECVKLLLAVPGIDVNKSDALHGAAGHGSTEIVKLLLAVPGIDINKKNYRNSTPLDETRWYGSRQHRECAKLLEDALAAQQTHAPGTAKPTVKTAQTGSDTTFDGLDSHISRIDYMTAGNATLKLYKKRLLTLLPMIKEGKGVDVTIPDSKGNTSLHYACGIGDVELVKWLLEHGANANAKTDKGKSPRQCIGKNRDSITLLLRQYGGN